MQLEKLGTPVISNMSIEDDMEIQLNNDSAVLYSLLRNLYSYPIMSVTREIWSNCVDATVQQDNGKPIEIWLNKNNIIFKDFGIGMSEETISKVYRSMGTSTKNDSNSLIGAFGIGSKSPLCIIDQFTLESTYDGIKHGYLIYIDETERGSIKPLFKQETNDGNGTVVTIPIKENEKWEWEAAIRSVIKFFPNQPRLYGIAQQDYIQPILNGKKWAIYKNTEGDNILYNNLPYKDTVGDIPHGVVLKFDIGEVNLTPNRETLRYTDKTKTAIAAAIANFHTEIQDHITQQIDAVDSFDSVVKIIHSIPGGINDNQKTWKWRGQEFKYPADEKYPWFRRRYSHKNSLELNHTRTLNPYSYGSASSREFRNEEVITLDKPEWNSYDRQRISYYMKEHNVDRVFLLKPDVFPVSGPNLSEIKVKRANPGPRGKKIAPTTVKGKKPGYGAKQDFPIDATDPILYYTAEDPLPYGWRNIHDSPVEIAPKDVKLIQDQPMWLTFDEYLETEYNAEIQLSEAKLHEIANNIQASSDWSKLSFLAPHFDEFKVTVYNTNVSDKTRKYVKYLMDTSKVIPKKFDFMEKYPLLQPLGWVYNQYYGDVIQYVKLMKKERGEVV